MQSQSVINILARICSVCLLIAILSACTDSPLIVHGKDASGAWLQVSIPSGPSGWMMTQYIQLQGDAGTLAIATALPPPTHVPTVVPVFEATIDDDNVNLRTGPGFEYPSLRQYSRGTKLKVYGRSDDNEWLKVTVANSRSGWMMTQYIAMKTDLYTVPVAEAPPAPPRTASTNPIRITLVRKEFESADYSAGVYNDYIVITLEITNRTGKKVRAFTGILSFQDLFDRTIYSGQLTYEDGLAANGTITDRRTIRYNQFIDSHVRLRNINRQDMQTTFDVEQIIFADGSKQSYP